MTDDDSPPGGPRSAAHEAGGDMDEGATGDAGQPDDNGSESELSDHERGPPQEELLTGVREIEAVIRWKWGIRALAAAAVVGVAVGAIGVFVLEWGPLPGIGAAVLVAVVGLGHTLLLYRSWEYEVRSDALYLERGVLTHVKTVVPFVRVQHIDTNRGPIDRALGLSSLVVYTAGSRGADVTIPGLTPEDAADLQDRLKLLAKESTGDDAV